MTTKKATQPKKKFGGRQEGSGRPDDWNDYGTHKGDDFKAGLT